MKLLKHGKYVKLLAEANDIEFRHRNRIGMWGRHFNWYHFLPPGFTLAPKSGTGIGLLKFAIGIPAKRRQIEQNFVIRGTEKSWVGFRLAKMPTV